MRFEPGWDREDPRTLRFIDAELESAYIDETTPAYRELLQGNATWTTNSTTTNTSLAYINDGNFSTPWNIRW